MTMLNIVGGYVFAAFRREEYSSAREMLLWGIDILQGLKKNDKPDILDKSLAEMFALLSCAQYMTGDSDSARETMLRAIVTARRFDAAPCYSMENIRFTDGGKSMKFNDVFGITASDSIEYMIGLLNNGELSSLWRDPAGRGAEDSK